MAAAIAWVHGIGHHQPGYSANWEAAFNPSLHLQHGDYFEVCWDTVFDQMRARPRTRAASRASLPVPLSEQEQLAEVATRRRRGTG